MLLDVVGEERSVEKPVAGGFHRTASAVEHRPGVECELFGLDGFNASEYRGALGLPADPGDGVVSHLARPENTQSGHAQRLCGGKLFGGDRDPSPCALQLPLDFRQLALRRRRQLGPPGWSRSQDEQ